jgi:DHA3 family macrolide efflux protein-like MFS transporter
MSLVPILVTGHFQGAAIQLGWLNAAWGLGLLLGGLTLGVWGGFKRRTDTILMGLAGLGSGLLLVAFAPAESLGLAIAGFFFASAMNAITNGSAFALLQSVVAPELQGRVFTVILSMAGAISPLSLAIAGPLADRLGVRALYFMAGGALLALAVAGALSPVVRNLESQAAQQG